MVQRRGISRQSTPEPARRGASERPGEAAAAPVRRECESAGGRRMSAGKPLGVPSAEAGAFGLGHAAPDAVTFCGGKGVLAALREHGAVLTDLFGATFAPCANGSLFVIVGCEEHVGVGAAARSLMSPVPARWTVGWMLNNVHSVSRGRRCGGPKPREGRRSAQTDGIGSPTTNAPPQPAVRRGRYGGASHVESGCLTPTHQVRHPRSSFSQEGAPDS